MEDVLLFLLIALADEKAQHELTEKSSARLNFWF